MDLVVERVDVWAASIKDEPGGLARVLTALREAGADLDFILARREADRPGTGSVFVTPLRGDAEVAAATELGFSATSRVRCLRVEGKNVPGVASLITEKLSAAGINLRGFSGAVLGARFVLYIGLDSEADAAKALSILQRA